MKIEWVISHAQCAQISSDKHKGAHRELHHKHKMPPQKLYEHLENIKESMFAFIWARINKNWVSNHSHTVKKAHFSNFWNTAFLVDFLVRALR